MGIYPSKDKQRSLSEAAAFVHDGDIVAVGGNLSAREPMAMIRELIRQGKRNLHTVGGAHGIDIDLMCAGGIVGTVQNSFVGLEADFGLAPNFRRSVENKAVKVKETDCVAILAQLRASQMGVPFMPTPPVRGTDILEGNPEVYLFQCPFTGEKINLLPAIKPNVAIIHAHKADPLGNIKLFPPFFADPLFVEASEKVIVTVEEIISEEEMKNLGATFPYYEITAIVEIPFGAHPTSCYPDYTYDRKHISGYMEAAQKGAEEFKSRFLAPVVYECNSQERYLQKIGGTARLAELKSWNDSVEKWCDLLCAE